ncbi:hypothetical protein EX461_18040 [Vibrio parahaemolyticus]|nr:hypothetical protein [Vibrio parahaemolyticus]EJG0012998.1 hypothetical protein [Vibrio parahaemolyticus]EJG0782052.1 hypothetical protein [Vibrio parahaemolyticus]EJS9799263.1 hypothetical protein [Vibrio parahaemolyticus]
MSGFFCSIIELDLSDVTGEVMRLTDAPFNLMHEGHEYQAFGSLLSIDKITNENTLSGKELGITLSGISIEFQEAVNNNIFRRKSIVISKAFVLDNSNEVDEAVVYWRGLTSTPETDLNYEDGYLAIKLTCKSIFDLDQTPSLMRCNSATHQAYHTGDLFYQYATQDQKDDVLWRKP